MRFKGLVLLALTGFGFAAAESEWTYISTSNFELYTSAGPAEARRTIEYFEQVRDFFMRAKSSEATTRLPVTIIAFRNTTQFKPYAPRESASAFYLGDRDRDYIVMSGTGPDQFPMAVHEYTHLLVRHSGMNLPAWLNEGLAEVYSTLRPQGGRVLVGLVPPARAQVLASERWLPLKRILEVSHDSPEYNERDRAGLFYAQSWLLVHMLMLDDYTRDEFPKFVDLVAGGLSSSEAFEQVWHLPLEYVEKKLNGYSRYRAFNGLWFDVKLRKFEGLEPSAADPVRVEIALAAITALSGQKEEASSRLKALGQQHPKNWRVQEALAMDAWRRSDLTAARQHFRRATDLNPPTWTTWFNYARVIHGMPDDYETAIRVLRRTLELNALNMEARVMLAEEYNYAQRYNDALVTASAVKRMEPEFAARLFLAVGAAHAELGNGEEARKAAARAKECAKEPWELRRAEDLLQLIEVRRQPRPPVITSPVETPSAAVAAPPRPTYGSVTGVFEELQCEGETARVKLSTEKGIIRFLIREPSRISIRGKGGAMTLTCGRQPAGRRITVEHVVGSNEIRAITFH